MPYQTPRYLRESGISADKLPKLVREQYEDLRLLTEDFKDESSPEYTEMDDHLFLAVKELHSSGRLETKAEKPEKAAPGGSLFEQPDSPKAKAPGKPPKKEPKTKTKAETAPRPKTATAKLTEGGVPAVDNTLVSKRFKPGMRGDELATAWLQHALDISGRTHTLAEVKRELGALQADLQAGKIAA